jgi:hypothetical protein
MLAYGFVNIFHILLSIAIHGARHIMGGCGVQPAC